LVMLGKDLGVRQLRITNIHVSWRSTNFGKNVYPRLCNLGKFRDSIYPLLSIRQQENMTF
jgi:hypothetical protein